MRKVRLCAVAELPAEGGLREFSADGRLVCLANEGGHLAAIDNVCPHRGGPLSEGTLDHGQVLCPWHAWAFDLKTGQAAHQAGVSLDVFALEQDGQEVWIVFNS